MTPDSVSPGSVEVRNVLVPLDGSDLALRALPTARALASRFGAELHTISTVSGVVRAEHLRAFVSGALGVDIGDDHVMVAEGLDPAEAIAARAVELDSALVCMTTHGRGRLRGAFVGSVARSVVERLSEPVVALGPMADNPGWSPRPRSWVEPLSVARIVACVDGSETSEQVLPLAAAWAGALGMSLTVATVVEDAPPPASPTRKSRYGDHADAETYISELTKLWAGHVPEADGVVLRDPISPASAIRQHLDERGAGLVAVTTHARSGLERIRLGAVAASIVHASTAPCLVAPVTSGTT